MKTPLVRGREFDAHDDEHGNPVAIINETLARQFFPTEDPIGKHITLDLVPDERPREIVGVVGNTFTGPLQAQHQPAIYLPHLQQTSQWIATSWMLRAGMYFVVRASAIVAVAVHLRDCMCDPGPPGRGDRSRADSEGGINYFRYM